MYEINNIQFPKIFNIYTNLTPKILLIQFIQSFELNNESIYNNILIHKINQKNIAVSL